MVKISGLKIRYDYKKSFHRPNKRFGQTSSQPKLQKSHLFNEKSICKCRVRSLALFLCIMFCGFTLKTENWQEKTFFQSICSSIQLLSRLSQYRLVTDASKLSKKRPSPVVLGRINFMTNPTSIISSLIFKALMTLKPSTFS